MKGVLLCGGSGLRLMPVTYTTPKEMIPVANIPVAEYIIKKLVESGINNIAMVVEENRARFENYFHDGRAFNCRIKYYNQPKPLGAAYGLLCAKEFIDDDDFILIIANNYIDFNLKEYINNFKTNSNDALLLVKQVINPWEYGVAVIEDGKITKVVEKPKITTSNTAIAGIYLFSSSILKAASKIKSTNKGEYEITDAIQYLIDKGYKVNHKELSSYWINIEKPKDVLDCNKYILEKCKEKIITGNDSRIINSKIGEHVSIGKRCMIKDSSINNSIILDDCIINGVEIYDSIICEYSTIAGNGSVNGIFAGKTKLYLNQQK